MVHGPTSEITKDKSENFKTRIGIINFIVYTAFYLIFVFICVLNPELVAMKVGSLNLAVAFGFFLIIVAILQAIIYNAVCSRREKKDSDSFRSEGRTAK